MIPSLPFSRALDQEPNNVLLLDGRKVIRFLNRAWTDSVERDHLAACRATALLGRPFLDFVAGPLRPYLAKAFERAAAMGPGIKSIWIHGECNTPQYFRRLTTRISPLWDPGQTVPTGYLVHSDVRRVGALSERYVLAELPVETWIQGDGFILQCGCCRRVRNPTTGEWAMSLELLERPVEKTSHGLCELCLETYYGKVD
jgi:hypothetical protein